MNYAVQHSQRYSKIFLKIIIIKQQINIQFNFKQGKKVMELGISPKVTHMEKCTVLVTNKIQIKTTQDLKFTRMARTSK